MPATTWKSFAPFDPVERKRGAGTYLVTPIDDDRSRLVAKLGFTAPTRLAQSHDPDLSAGDSVRIRKQVLTLKGLAERDAGVARRSGVSD